MAHEALYTCDLFATLLSNPIPQFIGKKSEADRVQWLPLGWANRLRRNKNHNLMPGAHFTDTRPEDGAELLGPGSLPPPGHRTGLTLWVLIPPGWLPKAVPRRLRPWRAERASKTRTHPAPQFPLSISIHLLLANKRTHLQLSWLQLENPFHRFPGKLLQAALMG